MWRVDSLEKMMLGKLRAGGEKGNRGWKGSIASLTRWTWVWVNSGSWWWTERPGVLRFMGSQRVGHDWATDLIWSDRESIQVIISQGKTAGPRSSSLLLPMESWMELLYQQKCVTTCMWYWQPENITQVFMSRVLIGASRLTALWQVSSLQPL